MALIFAINAQKQYVDEPPEKIGSNLKYGRVRKIFDRINFAQTPVAGQDDVVIYSINDPQTIWDMRIISVIGTDVAGLTLGLVRKVDGNFTDISSALTPAAVSEAITLFGQANAGAAAGIPQVVSDPSWLVLRCSGAGTVGDLKITVDITVE